MHTDDHAADAELITRYRAGDDDAATELFERHHGPARRFASRLAGRSAADDLAAEAFTRVLTALRNGKGPDVAFRPYLMTTVRNAHIKSGQRDNRILWVDDYEILGSQAAADDETGLRSESSLLAQAFATLPERWQTVLWHTSVEDDAREDVARLLGITPAAVGALAYRAREGLRQAYLSAHIAETDERACKSVRDKLAAYSRDQLGPRDTAAVEQHVDGCAACSQVLADLRGITSDLPALLLPALLGTVGAGALVRGRRRPRSRLQGDPSPFAVVLAAVAAVGIAAAAAVWIATSGMSDPTATPAVVETPTAAERPQLPEPSPTASAPVARVLQAVPKPVIAPPLALPEPTRTSDPEPKPTKKADPRPTPAPTPAPTPTPNPTPDPEPEPTGTTYDLVLSLANLVVLSQDISFDLVVNSPDGPSTLVIDVTSAGGWNFGAAPPAGASCTAPSGVTPVQITCEFAASFAGSLSLMLLNQTAGSAFTAALTATDNTDPTPADAVVSYP